jgi:ubiquinone/menaquinone biosynthesis C-methylase UbiE
MTKSCSDQGDEGLSPSAVSPSWNAFAKEYEKRVEPFTSKFAEEMLGRLLGNRNCNNETKEKKMSSQQDVAAASNHRRPKILDVGCGTGTAALLALSNGLDVAVTDVSEAMVERTKERAYSVIQAHDRDSAALFDSAVAEGQDLPSRWSDSFDLAVANFSVIFFPQPVLGLKEIFRCLLPGTGMVSFTAWGNASETPAFRVFPDVVREILPELAEKSKPKRITGSVGVLEKLLEDAGFVDVKVEGPVYKTLEVQSPSDYYDRFALSSPPTAATIAAMEASTRSKFRRRILEVATARGRQKDGSIALESGAYIAFGRKPAPNEHP